MKCVSKAKPMLKGEPYGADKKQQDSGDQDDPGPNAIFPKIESAASTLFSSSHLANSTQLNRSIPQSRPASNLAMFVLCCIAGEPDQGLKSDEAHSVGTILP